MRGFLFLGAGCCAIQVCKATGITAHPAKGIFQAAGIEVLTRTPGPWSLHPGDLAGLLDVAIGKQLEE